MRRIEEITTDFVKEKQEMLTNFDNYKKILVEELKVRQVIEKIYYQREAKYKSEISKLKTIIRIPRNHFKNLEKIRYQDMISSLVKLF